MSWDGKQWKLGKDTSMPPVYGSRIPLSPQDKNVCVTHCPRCRKPLDEEHPGIAPGDSTMWLAKAYGNALFAIWDKELIKKSGGVPLACAAKAEYKDANGNLHAVYYVAPPKEGIPQHRISDLTRARKKPNNEQYEPFTVDSVVKPLKKYTRLSVPSGMSGMVIFPDVMDHQQGGMGAMACNVREQSWLDGMTGICEKIKQSYCTPHSPSDTDKAPLILHCAEQRVIVCHRWANAHPEKAGLTGVTPGSLKLNEVTAALVDIHHKVDDDLAIWWRTLDEGDGFPMHPCNTCRVMIPGLLCDGGFAGPPDFNTFIQIS